MAIGLMKLHAALRAANVPEQQAREAAEELAGYENRLAKIESDLMLLKWMVGSVLALVLGLYAVILRGTGHG